MKRKKLILAAILFCSLNISTLTAFAEEAPPSIDFSFNDSGSDSSSGDSDAPPSLSLPDAETPTNTTQSTSNTSTSGGSTGSTGSSSSSTSHRISATGPAIFGLIPLSLVLGYAVSRKLKKN